MFIVSECVTKSSSLRSTMDDRALFRALMHSFRGRIAELFIRRRSGRGGMIDYVRFQDGIQSTSESTIGR